MGKYKGIAPGCSLISLKVLDRFGNGNKEDILAAFRWIENHREEYKIRIVNISVGTTYKTRSDKDVLVRGVESLWDQGLVVVAAAGNRGPEPGSITAPGCSKKVITVGSSDMLLGKTAISGRGPTFECVCKPDLVGTGAADHGVCTGSGEYLCNEKRYFDVYTGDIRSGGTCPGKGSDAYKCGYQDDAA